MPVVIGPDGESREMPVELQAEVMRGAFRAMMGGSMPGAPGADIGYQAPEGREVLRALMERLGRRSDVLEGGVDTRVTPELVEKAYGVAEQAGFASGGMTKWSTVKKAIEGIPKYRPGGFDTIADLHKQFPGMPKGEFDEMVLGLAKEGKIALHRHDLPASYKGEMVVEEVPDVVGGKIVKGKAHYHGFSITPEWRGLSSKLQVREFKGMVGERSHTTRVEEGFVPTESISHLLGEVGEIRGAHRNRMGAEWEAFKEDIRKNGIKNPIFILKDPGKPAVISEGNHRLDAAIELGLKEVPVEIKYFGHAEREGLAYKEYTPEWR